MVAGESMRTAERNRGALVAKPAMMTPPYTRVSSLHASPAGGGVLTAMVLLAAAYFVPRGLSWNADTHLFLTASIVDRGSLNIDPLASFTGDVAASHGHYFADKAPGLSFLAVPVYALLKYTLLGGQPLTAVYAVPAAHRLDFLVRYVLALVFSGVPTAIIAVLMYRFLPRLGVSLRWSAGLALTYSLGTIAHPFAAQFFSHQLAAALLFGAFVVIYRVRQGELSRRHLVWVGALLGYAVITEYPVVLIIVCLGMYAIMPPIVPAIAIKRPAVSSGVGSAVAASLARLRTAAENPTTVRIAARLLVGAIIPLALGALYNTAAFGGPLSTGYAHLAGPEVFRAGQSQGLLGITVPHLDALWSTTFGPYRGIFLLSPVLLLTIPGLRAMWRLPAWRGEAILLLAVLVVYGLFSISYYMWDGGFSMGPRQFLPALPFMLLPIGALLGESGHARWRRATLILAAISVVVVELASAVGPLVDPKYPFPMTDWVLPRLLAGTLDNNWGMLFGLPSLLQLAPLVVALALLYHRHWRATYRPATLPARDDHR